MAEDDGDLVRILLELISASGEVELQDIAIAAEELTVTFEGRAAPRPSSRPSTIPLSAPTRAPSWR
jgi:hypothetical protein